MEGNQTSVTESSDGDIKKTEKKIIPGPGFEHGLLRPQRMFFISTGTQ